MIEEHPRDAPRFGARAEREPDHSTIAEGWGLRGLMRTARE
jgi:hypothetical protein